MFLTGFCTLIFFTNLSQKEFLDESSTSFLFFSISGCYREFWKGNLFKKELLILEFPRVLFFNQLYCYIFIIFLVIKSVMMLSLIMMLHSTLICRNSWILLMWDRTEAYAQPCQTTKLLISYLKGF